MIGRVEERRGPRPVPGERTLGSWRRVTTPSLEAPLPEDGDPPRTALRRAALALGVTLAHATILLAVASQRIAYGTVGARNMFDDVEIYFRYASKALAGAIPYRDFVVEYPLFAFPVFFLPRLFASTFAHYKVAFGVEMLAADGVAVLLAAHWIERTEGPRRVAARLAWYTLGFAAFCPLLICRFDLAAMALAFAAAWAWSSGRPRLGGTLAGVGTLMKIFPGVIAAPALVWEAARGRGRGRWAGILGTIATVVAGTALWLVLGGGRVRESLGYHLERGVEAGSLYSGGLLLAARASGVVPRFEYLHCSLEVKTPWSASAAHLGFPLQALALALVMWRTWRRGASDPMRPAAAAVLGFIVFGKVLSPQYLLWLLPFMAVLRGRVGWWSRGLFLLACVVTTMLYPLGFHWLLIPRGWMIGLLNYRNALLLGTWCLLLFGPEERAPEAAGAIETTCPA